MFGVLDMLLLTHKCFVTFRDDYSCFNWIYFLHAKSEVFDAFQKFLALVQNQYSESIKILWSDLGGNISVNNSKIFCKLRTCPYALQQNKVVERKN